VASVRHDVEAVPATVLGLAHAGERPEAELAPAAERLLSMLATSLAAEREAREGERAAREEARVAHGEATAARLAAERLQRVAAAAVAGRGLRGRRRARRQLRELLGA
jgi:hypothetical protein